MAIPPILRAGARAISKCSILPFATAVAATALVVPLAAQPTPLTQIVDSSCRNIAGQPCNGTVVVAQRAVTPAGTVIGPGSVVLVETNGTLYGPGGRAPAMLYPGTYAVTYKSASDSSNLQFTWTVTTMSPTSIAAIQSDGATSPLYPFAYTLVGGMSLGSFLWGGPTGAMLLMAPANGTWCIKFLEGVPSWVSCP
jgi:hypothetical protein